MYLGIDIGGTKLEAILIEKKTAGVNVLQKKRTATDRDQGYYRIIENLTHLIKDTCPNTKELIAIGIGLPGTVDPKTGMMIKGNTRALENMPLAEDLKKNLNFGAPVLIENDANCFALAEVYAGAGVNYEKDFGVPCEKQNAVGVILGTGVGGGVVINGKVVGGRRGAGGEIGHMTLHPNGRACYCDRKGCAEQYLSGPAIELEQFNETGKKLPAPDVFQASGNVLKNYQKNLAAFLGNIANVLDPDYFVLGGGVSLQKSIYENISEDLPTQLFVSKNPPPVYQHVVGDSAGSLGAAMVAWRNWSEPQ